MALNVLGTALQTCSADPLTGFFRNGTCDTCREDSGMHTVCAQVTNDFLIFSKQQGNDLSTPFPEFNFPGLKPGDFWCVCMGRWIEALKAGVAPPLKLEACHISLIEFVDLNVLKDFSAEKGDT